MSKGQSKKKNNSRAKRKLANSAVNKANSNGSNRENKAAENAVQVENANQAQPDAKLTVYTASAMLTILVSAAATAIAMVMLGKPAYYIMEASYGKGNNASIIDTLGQFAFEAENNTKLVTLFVIMSILIGISAFLSLVSVIRAMDPIKKPSILLSVIAFAAGAAAMIIFLYDRSFAAGLSTVDFIEKSPMFGIYDILFIAVIANTAFLLINTGASALGLARWKKDGKAY